jgi:hypothetical protein
MSESEDTDILPAPSSILRAPTDITTVNSTLAKVTIPTQDSLAKVTYYKLDLDTILDGLIPNPLPESSGKDNAIHHLNIIVFGKPNTGKTTLAESIAEALARRYGQRNVKALRATRDLPGLFQNIDKLFSRFRKPPKAILLFADDMTKALRKLSGTVEVKSSNGQQERMRRLDYWLDKWYDIRGELFKRGMREGLVVMVAGLHRFYGGDVDLRADADLLLVRSTGTPGTFDANKVEKMLGSVVYYAMRQHEVDALRDRNELAWTAFVAKTGSGVFRVPRPSVSTKWLMRNVGSSEVSQELAPESEAPLRNSVVEVRDLKKKSASEVVESKKKLAVEEKPFVRPRQRVQPREHRPRHGRRLTVVVAAAGALALAFLVWKYVWPFLR